MGKRLNPGALAAGDAMGGGDPERWPMSFLLSYQTMWMC